MVKVKEEEGVISFSLNSCLFLSVSLSVVVSPCFSNSLPLRTMFAVSSHLSPFSLLPL